MDRYKRVEKPRTETAISENEIRITAKGLIRNYISYATSLLQDKQAKEIILKATGQAISKAVSIAEILKKNTPGLYQDASISSTSITDVWEPIEEGLVPLEMTRHVSMISIYLSTKELNSNSPGYQAPAYVEQPKRKPQRQYYQQRQQQFKQALIPITENSYVPGRGRGRGRNSGGRGGYGGGDYNNGGYGGGDYNSGGYGGGDYNSGGYGGRDYNSGGYDGNGGYSGGYSGGYGNSGENGGWNYNWNGNGRGRTGSFRAGTGYERGRGRGRRGYGGGQGYENEGARGYEGGGDGRRSYEGGGGGDGRRSYEGGGGRGYNRGRGRMAPRGRAY